ncbi:hypothetical protein KY343_04205, partial [Candidatus Woesearchaeota archaeon]|nr:hypothetical protein [Candidatus Woesearchaeota archaeon]
MSLLRKISNAARRVFLDDPDFLVKLSESSLCDKEYRAIRSLLKKYPECSLWDDTIVSASYPTMCLGGNWTPHVDNFTADYLVLDNEKRRMLDDPNPYEKDDFITSLAIGATEYSKEEDRFTGFDADEIPEEIASLEHLTNLAICRGRLKRLGNLKGLKDLRVLYVVDCELETLDGLEDLNLAELVIGNRSLKDIEGLKSQVNLRKLELSSDSIYSIEGYLDGMTELRELYLGSTDSAEAYINSTNCGLKTTKGIGNLKKLEKLVLQGNYGIKVEEIGKLTNLKELDISQISLESVEGIGLERLDNLEYLNLADNPIEDPFSYILEQKEKGNLPKLNRLHIWRNPVNYQDWRINKKIKRLSDMGIKIEGLPNISFEERDLTLFMPQLENLFPGSYQLVAEEVDKKIEDLETITLDSISGRTGGGVGRFNDNGKEYAFKIERDYLAAYKSTRAASIIHERVNTDELAKRLARRIPKALLSEPVKRGEYWVGFFEDITNKVIAADENDLKIMKPELDRGLDYKIIDNLYTIALYQEVLTAAMIEERDPYLEVEKVPTNLAKKEIIERFKSNPELYQQIKNEIDMILEGYDERVGMIKEAEKKGSVIGHYDNRPNENRKNGFLLDYGSTKKGFEVADIAREFICRPEIVKNPELFNEYINAFIRMRKRV